MKAGRPKQFLELFGRPVLYWSLAAIAPLLQDGLRSLVLTHPPGGAEDLRSLLQSFPEGHPYLSPAAAGLRIELVEGGASRQTSVSRGLAVLDPAVTPLVCIHDAARPFASACLFRQLLKLVSKEHAAGAVPILPVVDTVKTLSQQRTRIAGTVDRSCLGLVQTPQVFPLEMIRDLHQKAAAESLDLTDDCGLVEHYLQQAILACEGERWNLKLTHSEDLRLMHLLVEAGLVSLPEVEGDS